MKNSLSLAAQLFIASFGALLLAHWLELTSPFWAAMPVWVVVQVWREDMLLRAALRLAGTLLGAGLALAALHFAHSGWVLVIALSATVGLGTAVAFWIGTIYSYGALLAAITASVVVLPTIGFGAEPVSLSIGRVACTLIGVAAVTLVTFPFTPARTMPRPPRHAPALLATVLRGGLAALLSGSGVALAIATGRYEVTIGALTVATFASILGSIPDPRPVLKHLLPAAGIGVVAALAYRGMANGLDLSAASSLALVAPFIAAGALLRANPSTAPFGLDANMCFLLAAEVGSEGHGYLRELSGAAAMMAGAALVCLLFLLVLRLAPVTPPEAEPLEPNRWSRVRQDQVEAEYFSTDLVE